MPLYNYVCEKCSKMFEVFHKLNEWKKVKCPHCKKTMAKKIMPVCFKVN